jgi:hypothetical protein
MGFLCWSPPVRQVPGRLGRAVDFTWMQKITSFLQDSTKTAGSAPRVDYDPGGKIFNYI